MKSEELKPYLGKEVIVTAFTTSNTNAPTEITYTAKVIIALGKLQYNAMSDENGNLSEFFNIKSNVFKPENIVNIETIEAAAKRLGIKDA